MRDINMVLYDKFKSVVSNPVTFIRQSKAVEVETPSGLFNLAEKCGFHVALIDALAIENKASLFKEIASGFQFPDYFGKNWSALSDCLGDLAWLPAQGHVLILKNGDHSFKHDCATMFTFLDIWYTEAKFRRERKKAPHFYLVIFYE